MRRPPRNQQRLYNGPVQSETKSLSIRSFLRFFLIFMVGIMIGLTFAEVMNTYQYEIPNISTSRIYQQQRSAWQIFAIEPMVPNQVEDMDQNITKNNDLNTTIADHLYGQVRVLCWILTSPMNHGKRAIHVKNTWGSRCNKLIFMSSEEDEMLGAVKLPVGEGTKKMWLKTREGFKYIYDHFLDEYDWFVKADDDTYMIVENLRLFLYPMSSEAPVYFGCKNKRFVRQGYMSGGAGYVLSRTAVRRFIELAYPNGTICRQNESGFEDVEMGKCLQNVGVIAGDSRDNQNRGRFFPLEPKDHFIPQTQLFWYWHYMYYATEDGLNCFSDYAISLHYVSPHNMYVFDYLIYTLRPFGILPNSLELPPKKNMTELLNKWRYEESDNL